MDDKTLVELFDDAYCALMAMRTDHPEKIWPTSFVYPDEVRNNAEIMREAFEALQSRIKAMEAALRDMVQAVCGETGFAAAVRNDAGLPYPWPALDIAEERATKALGSQP